MAFALTAAYIYPELIKSPVANRHANQIIELEFTGLATDLDLDVGDLAGTFWSAADNAAMGAAVLAAITLLYPQFSLRGCVALQSVQLLPRLSAAAITTNSYVLTVNSTTLLPEIALNTAEGITIGQLRMVCPLNNGQLGMTAVYPPAP
jgi:hypothetical protein